MDMTNDELFKMLKEIIIGDEKPVENKPCNHDCENCKTEKKPEQNKPKTKLITVQYDPADTMSAKVIGVKPTFKELHDMVVALVVAVSKLEADDMDVDYLPISCKLMECLTDMRMVGFMRDLRKAVFE